MNEQQMRAKAAAVIQRDLIDPQVAEVEREQRVVKTPEEKAAARAALYVLGRLTAVLTRMAHKECE